jgi:hypothetical protein
VLGKKNRSTASIDFEVEAAEGFSLGRVYNFPNPFKPGGAGTSFVVTGLTEPANVQVKVYSVSGSLVRRLEATGGPGQLQIAWDGRDDRGDRVANAETVRGILRAAVRARSEARRHRGERRADEDLRRRQLQSPAGLGPSGASGRGIFPDLRRDAGYHAVSCRAFADPPGGSSDATSQFTGFLLAAATAWATQASAQTAALSLSIPPTGRANGMGQAYVAIADDASATWWNPGGMAFLDKKEASLTYAKLVPDLADDVFIMFPAYTTPVKTWGTFGASIVYLSYGTSNATSSTGEDLGTFTSYEMAPTLSTARR